MKYLITLLFISLAYCFTGCTNEASKIEETENEQDPKELLSSFFGKYSGLTDEGEDVSVWITEFINDDYDFMISSAYDQCIPPREIPGDIHFDELELKKLECNHCLGLSSPGGVERYYTLEQTNTGEYFPENDSLYVKIIKIQTEDFPCEYEMELFLKKVE